MKSVLKVVALLAAFVVVGGLIVFVYLLGTGLKARPEPGAIETFAARTTRKLVIGWHARNHVNPVPVSYEAIVDGRAHFADHCASCHANDGSGDTEMGRGLYPKAPDIRLPATQNLSDGELFYIIENGIRLTGMPAWGTDTKAGEESSWRLVHFIRHLPRITPEEIEQMEAMNPRLPEEIRQEIEAERFLQGGDSAAVEEPQPHGH
ncbi:MAG TPA: c-type cytochrome [Vicinamibacterales bacterium]|nr:c-type cytochrome [Vicinamibacterales bacterium]